MTEIGSSTNSPHMPAGSAGGEQPHAHHFHDFLHSLTSSLDLACRGYLCMQLVDCDPITDPECGPAGKKLVIRETAGDTSESVAHDGT